LLDVAGAWVGLKGVAGEVRGLGGGAVVGVTGEGLFMEVGQLVLKS
jgi:hypothetical protein